MARVYRATVEGHYADGTIVRPSVHYQTDVPALGDEPAPNDIADAIWSHIGTAWHNCSSSDVRYDQLVVSEQTVPPAVGVAGVHAINANGTNGLGSGNEPQGRVASVNLHTGTRSRSARGHFCMPPPLSATALSNGSWVGSYMTTLGALAALLDDSFDVGSVVITHVNPVVYSRTRALRGQDPFTFRVTGASANPRPHWLRSRMTSP